MAGRFVRASKYRECSRRLPSYAYTTTTDRYNQAMSLARAQKRYEWIFLNRRMAS